MFKVATALQCDAGQKRRLEDLVRAGKTPQKVVQRANIILLAASGMSNNRIAKAVKTTRPTVLVWRARFEQFGCPGLLKDLQRPGRKPKISDEKIQDVIELTLHQHPEGATHWSTRTLAKKTGLSHVAVQRIWKHHGLQPHRVETFKISTDKRFVEKIRDIVGLYLKPPERALVCCPWMKKVKSKHWIVRSRACP
jgi:transposase